MQNNDTLPPPPTGEHLFLRRFILQQTLGQGTYGKVALKIIDKGLIKSARTLEQLKDEVRILHLVRHPYIASLFEVF
eukprot:jgi/Hompol1/5128/HPOL_000439-RA